MVFDDVKGVKFFPPTAREFHQGGGNEKISSSYRLDPANEPNYSSPGRPLSAQGMGTIIGNPPLVGSTRNHRKIIGKVMHTSRIAEKYPFVIYFMSQSWGKMSTNGGRQPQAFLQITQGYLEEWRRRDRELKRKVKNSDFT